jgi:tRNA(Ile)-lysidine synthase
MNACRAPAPFAIALSGGPDSVTLMHLAAAHCRAHGLALPLVFSVDHGLRPESAEEARSAGDWARALGLAHEVLTWEGPKPEENIQAAARAARYALLGSAMRRRGVWALLTGHTLDDQAETFLLRLARGSGLDGLSGMAPLAAFPDPAFRDLCILRPLLGFTKAQILATAHSLGARFFDDPGNRNPQFARTRARLALNLLEPAGVTPRRIAEAAGHLRRARAAIEALEADAFERSVTLTPWGYALITPGMVASAPLEVGLRMTASILRLTGGGRYAPEFETVQGVHSWFGSDGGTAKGRTAGGVRLQRLPDGCVLAGREQAALDADEPLLRLQPGESGVWDGRFRVTLGGPGLAAGAVVRAVGTDNAAKALSEMRKRPDHQPRRIAATLPGLFVDGVLAAMPSFDGSGPAVAQYLGRMPHATDW